MAGMKVRSWIWSSVKKVVGDVIIKLFWVCIVSFSTAVVHGAPIDSRISIV